MSTSSSLFGLPLPKVLLVDSDLWLLSIWADALRQEGFNILTATDGLQALRRWRDEHPDVVVLEIDLPRLSGFEVCRQIWEEGATPIILLSTSGADELIVRGFRLGADDYVTKPFSLRELALRIQVLARRATQRRVGGSKPEDQLQIGDLVLDWEAHEVRQGDSLVRLTPIECHLLYLLANNTGRVISTSRLADYAWPLGEGEEVGRVKSHISHLRKKLERVSGGRVSIRAVSGVGYRFLIVE